MAAVARAAACVALAAIAAAHAVAAATVDVIATGDNTLIQTSDGSVSDGAGPVFFAGDAGTSPRRALVRFTVAASVPAGATIAAAVLTLHLSQTPNANTVPIELHRVTSDWGEGTSSTTGGGGAPSTPGDATWLHTFYPGQFWTNPGGDFVAAASAARTVTGVASYTWSSPEMVADAQAWLDDPTHDFGWLLLGDEAGMNTARRFDSRENAILANRPTLTITYGAPVAVRAATWSRIKRLYR